MSSSNGGSAIHILYVGHLTPGGTCLQRQRAFEDLECRLTLVDLASPTGLARERSLWERVRRKLLGPRDWTGANRQICEWVRRDQFDALWIDRGLQITAATLREVKAGQPQCRIIGYSPDDMYARHNQSPRFRRHLHLYDIFFTTKSYGVAELKAMGCPDAVFLDNAYDPHTHRSLSVSAEERQLYGGAVGFVGTWEPARAQSLYQLAQAGIPVRIWGNMWERCRTRHPNLTIEGRALYGDDYARALNAFDINLCFLRKQNRDLQTTRSVEIPACGAFMLAERTPEHEALFEPGREAEFFDSDDELLAKVRHYLAHPEQRQRIAAAGRQRCLRDGYRYQDRLAAMLDRAGITRQPAADTQRGRMPERSRSESCASPS